MCGIQDGGVGYGSHKQGGTGCDHTGEEHGMRRGPGMGQLGTLMLKGRSGEEKPEKQDCKGVSRDVGRKAGCCDVTDSKGGGNM